MTTTLLENPQAAPCQDVRAASMQRASAIVELRQYALHPGRRDTLIELFEREFVETQEAAGMELIGQFRDLDDPDRFVWLRGFSQRETRASALRAFYGGWCWRAHRDAANATMIDSDDVLLLRPSRPVGGFALSCRDDAATQDVGVVQATIYQLASDDACDFVRYFEQDWLPLLWEANVGVVATLVSERAPNDFPALPVREDASVFVWFSCHASVDALAQAQARIEQALEWAPRIADALASHLAAPPQTLRLAPTRRSRLRGSVDRA